MTPLLWIHKFSNSVVNKKELDPDSNNTCICFSVFIVPTMFLSVYLSLLAVVLHGSESLLLSLQSE